MSQKYLISISIGPVQDFIASARRSRDLWFGSWLLSELSKTVAKKIGEANLIFPAIFDPDHLEENSNFNVVNKILAVVSNIDENFDKNLKTVVRERLAKIYSPIFDDIEKKLKSEKSIFYRTKAEAQIKDMTELYWVAIPFDENIDDYKICRERVEILLNARKSTRDFASSTTWAGNVPKSSLDGQRESVIEDTEIDDVKIQKIFGLRKKERLCGVGVLKRLAEKGTEDDRFFSTSHVASLPLISTLQNKENSEEIKSELENYVKKLKNLGIEEKDLGKVPQGLEAPIFGKHDGHLLFENRLSDLPFENEKLLGEAKEALKRFMKDAFDKENAKPLPYYALLLADGDRMGTVIDYQKEIPDHKNLSKALSDFAGKCKTIVEENNGCLIYSGGDDVLAFLPLHTVLDCAKDLSEEFYEKLSADKKFVDDKGIHPTLSVGIAIYHHTEPLQDALTTARNAEKAAKSVENKNALAIILSKRSGADTTVKGSWKNDRETEKSFDERLKWFIQLHLDDALPDGAAYQLRDLWLRLKELTDQTPMRKEAVRILQRKRSNQGLSKVSKKILDEIEPLILSKEFSLEDLTNEIIVARDFARAYKQADKKAIKGEAE